MRTIASMIAAHTRTLLILCFVLGTLPLAILITILPIYGAGFYGAHYDALTAEMDASLAHSAKTTLNDRLGAIGDLALSLATEAGQIFSYSNRYSHYINVSKEGGLHRNKPGGEPATLFADVDGYEESRRKMARLSLMEPILETAAKSQFVRTGFVYIDDPMILLYPPVKSLADWQGDFNITRDISLYEHFRKNPRKQWRLRVNGGNPIVAAPIFSNDRLIGSAGFELTPEFFADILKSVYDKKDGFLAIVDTANKKIIAGSLPQNFDLREYLASQSANVKDEPKTIGEYNLMHDRVENLPLAVISGSHMDANSDEAAKVRDLILLIAAGVVAFTLLFYVIAALKAMRDTRLLAEGIVRPLDIVSRFLYRLGDPNVPRVEPTGLTEIDDLANHMRLAHTKILPPLAHDHATGLENRHALETYLDGKHTYGLIIIGLFYDAGSPARFLAANAFMTREAASVANKLFHHESRFFVIDACQLAILTDEFTQEGTERHAAKIAEVLNNTEFIFEEQRVQMRAIAGSAFADRADAKLIAAAEKNLLKLA
ncbi:MAG: hypothetical protein LBU73_09185 [Helicobacteraceae bacterium]|jgi:hypothetical protein|nr:hypothetical protein [Helicobacteraceae bacterium]